MKFLSLIIWPLFFLSIALPAQDLFFEHLSVNEGLSHSDANNIVQDSSGYIWIGTNNGLNRYDGYQITIFKKTQEDQSNIPDSRIRTLYYSSQHILWVGTERGGLCYFDPEKQKFVSVPILKNGRADVVYIGEDQERNLIVYTFNNGLFKLVLDMKNQHYSAEQVIDRSMIIHSIIVLPEHYLLGTPNGLILYDQKEKKNVLGNKFLLDGVIHAMHQDRDSNIWVGWNHGLIRLSWGHGQRNHGMVKIERFSFPKNIVARTIFKESSGTIWVGTLSSGVFLIKHSPEQPIQIEKVNGDKANPNTLKGNKINRIFEDRFHNIWVCTSGTGASYFNKLRKPFYGLSKNQNSENTLPDNYISAVYEKKPHELWIGTRGGLSVYDFQSQKYQNLLHDQNNKNTLSGNHISRIFEDSRGRMWVATRSSGLNLVYLDGRRAMVKRINSQNSALSSDEVINIVEDDYGRIWIATFSNGLNIIDPDTYQVFNSNNSNSKIPDVSSPKLDYLYKDPFSNIIWIGTRDNGLKKIEMPNRNIFHVSHIKLKQEEEEYGSNYIWPIISSDKGHLWVGSIGGGLYELIKQEQGYQINRYTIKDGLPDNDIESLLKDDDGNIWIGGHGLAKLNTKTREIKKFDVWDGLQSNSFKIGAACNGIDGRLYFGGINGLNYFTSSEIGDNTIPPKVVINRLSIFNEPIGVGDTINRRVLLDKSINHTKKITIKHLENDFTIGFTGIHFASPRKNKYKYKLEGYNDDWVSVPASIRQATFTNLRSGEYTFLVAAANSDGYWNERLARLEIVILPPWWKTWWAMTIYALVFIGMMLTYQYLANKQAALKNELIMAEKEKQLNNLKFQFFTNISHELRTPLTLIFGPLNEIVESGLKTPDVEHKIHLMDQNVRRLISLTNQLLDFRKLETNNMKLFAAKGNIVTFMKELHLFFTNKADSNSIQYDFNADPDNIQLYFDRNKLEVVVMNLLSNAFKYAQEGGYVKVNLSAKGDFNENAVFNDNGELKNCYAELTISDDGIGMNEDQLNSVFDRFYQASSATQLKVMGTGIGLSLAKGMVELHKGNITVQSETGKGTVFTVRLPFGKQHLKEDDVLDNFVPSDHLQHYPSPISRRDDNVAMEVVENSEKFDHYQILLVEDNEGVRNYLKNSLEKNFRIIEAKNGKEGLSKTREFIPDLIISDVMMPEMDGIEMCRTIKKDHELNYIPIILLTARTASVFEIEGIETGANDYITKPFNIKVLRHKIQNYITLKERIREFYLKNIRLDEGAKSINSKDEKFLMKAMSFIASNVEEPQFGVAELVREMAMSQSALYKRLKSLTGRSIVEFIRDIRIKKAAELIKNENYNVSEAAYIVGFSDQKYFRKCFKEQFKVNPSEYSESMAGDIR